MADLKASRQSLVFQEKLVPSFNAPSSMKLCHPLSKSLSSLKAWIYYDIFWLMAQLLMLLLTTTSLTICLICLAWRVSNNALFDILLNIFEALCRFFQSCQKHWTDVFQLCLNFSSESALHVVDVGLESAHLRGHIFHTANCFLMTGIQVV